MSSFVIAVMSGFCRLIVPVFFETTLNIAVAWRNAQQSPQGSLLRSILSGRCRDVRSFVVSYWELCWVLTGRGVDGGVSAEFRVCCVSVGIRVGTGSRCSRGCCRGRRWWLIKPHMVCCRGATVEFRFRWVLSRGTFLGRTG